ncbi:bifunctional hydroxymethylpyrimidine kinase/phosphomethylpyrimidine kinase [Lysinibacillus sp. BW-2-10]|uniref:bifunctional hydroxymethylpyrimidine kinase/phosphomethylpyrimidine kinase n=1 Tax=Lysinibacillus sp. BW-2-10 TaxID=2590030 RepID=UPI00117CE5B3|nr:bifunctional hydroxymethylpyrimidine kinase/phosphomethylpyrimidine kinase [Lysinibacillus sp. BW-2-10]TSI04271.1 bifunctional hydroxymethylpyrimidine kinase/phosphomethylpyrimidine kinase [Lysinibacillus sp. BW-2-10]
MPISKACTIAGSAARGGAGIQADLKTFQEFGVFGMSAITAFVATHPETKQNIFIQPLDVIEAQLSTIYEQGDIDALKTGMLFSKEIIDLVSTWLQTTTIRNVVVDPVMFGKAGSALLDFEAMDTLKTKLIPQANIITPNMPEATYLLGGDELTTLADLQDAARDLYQFGPDYILVKGGRLHDAAIDVLYDGVTMTLLEAPRIDTIHTNGAGCSYSAAITAGLANGLSMQEAVVQAKKFVTAGIRRSIPFEKVAGMIDHRAYKQFGEDGVKVTSARNWS